MTSSTSASKVAAIFEVSSAKQPTARYACRESHSERCGVTMPPLFESNEHRSLETKSYTCWRG